MRSEAGAGIHVARSRRERRWWTVSLIALAACRGPQTAAVGTVEPVYDAAGRVRVLKYDGDRDGKIDAVGDVEGTRIVRVAVDDDEDGRPDRWEYYGPDQRLEKVGFSTTGDGRENAWSFAGADGDVERIAIAGRQDGRVSRVEHFVQGRIVRADDDRDGDGLPDKWETYENGRLTSVAFDSAHRGSPDRRVRYGADGTTDVEVDPQGDGHWRPVATVAVPR
jgi:hypothetical protein